MEKAIEQFISRFAEVTPGELEAISRRVELREVRKKEILCNIGDKEEYLHLVLKGVLRKFFYKNRDEVITQLASENELISSSVSFFSGEPSLYKIEAIEPCVLLSISRKNLEELYELNPSLERIGRLITTEMYIQKEKWEQEHIGFDIRERFVHFMHTYPELIRRVPQKYIASYLNIKPETFSRLKHLLKRSPLVATLS